MHTAQLMPLPLTVSCFSKIQIGFTFLVPAHPGSPRKRAVKRVCVCVCVLHEYSKGSVQPWKKNKHCRGYYFIIIIIIIITRVSVAVEVAGRGERQTEPCVETVETSTLVVAHRPTDDSRRRRLRPNALHANTPSAARGPNICKLRRSYDNATVTIDLRRRTSTLENILRRAQGFP